MEKLIDKFVRLTNERDLCFDVIQSLHNPQAVILKRRELLELDAEIAHVRAMIFASLMAQYGYKFESKMWIKVEDN